MKRTTKLKIVYKLIRHFGTKKTLQAFNEAYKQRKDASRAVNDPYRKMTRIDSL